MVKEWDGGEICIEKARWGRYTLLQGKTKIELPKETEIEAFTKEQALALLSEKAPKTAKKKTTTAKK